MDGYWYSKTKYSPVPISVAFHRRGTRPSGGLNDWQKKILRSDVTPWKHGICEIGGGSSDYLFTAGSIVLIEKFTGPFRWRSPFNALCSLFGKSLFRLIVVEISSSPATEEKRSRCERARCAIHREQSTRIYLFFFSLLCTLFPSCVPNARC